MANVYATKTGNWSDTTVWNTGSLPTASDNVYANTYTVTIDQAVTVLSLRTTSTTGVTAGGGFTCSTAQTIDCSAGSGLISGSTTCLTLSHAAGTVTLRAAIPASVTTASVYTLLISSTGTTNITGNVTGCLSSVNFSGCINVTANATISITGNVVGANQSNAGRTIDFNATAASCTITGNVGGGIGTNPVVININGNVTLTIVGSVYNTLTNSSTIYVTNGAPVISITGAVSGSTVTAGTPALFCQSGTATVSVIGSLTANAGPAISGNATSTMTLTGPFISSATGVAPFNTSGIVKLSAITGNEFRFKSSGAGMVSLWSTDVNGGQPAASNVRSGVTYGVGGALTGTCAVPPASAVGSGVPVDNTTGTAALSPAHVAALVGAQIAAALNATP